MNTQEAEKLGYWPEPKYRPWTTKKTRCPVCRKELIKTVRAMKNHVRREHIALYLELEQPIA